MGQVGFIIWILVVFIFTINVSCQINNPTPVKQHLIGYNRNGRRDFIAIPLHSRRRRAIDLTQDDRVNLLEEHNNYRNNEKSTNMKYMVIILVLY